jgi:hypothetical protein
MRRNCVRSNPPCPRRARHAIFSRQSPRLNHLPLWASPLLIHALPIYVYLSNRDTRVLLCSTDKGIAFPMTENHHADARVEAIRLRRMMGAALIADSFGESRYPNTLSNCPLSSFTSNVRWMGALANTRGSVSILICCLHPQVRFSCRLGDLQYKKFGVTPEPEVRTKLLEGCCLAIPTQTHSLMDILRLRLGVHGLLF